VGIDGGTAAWLQQQAVELMQPAVEVGQADPTELAYLTDRVAVNLGQPQTYGSQIRCRAGVPAPATPIIDSERVDEVRASVGLGTLDDYYQELAMMCADEAADGQQPID